MIPQLVPIWAKTIDSFTQCSWDARRHTVLPVALICLCALLFFYRLAARDLWGSHEARAAQNAQRMLDDHAWLVPRLFDDHFDLQKPPMYYWLVAGLTRLGGGRVNAWTERLPAAIAATLCVFAVFYFLHRRGRPLAAFLGAVVLATAQHFTWLARTGRIDMPLTLALTVAVLTIGMSQRWQFIRFVAIAMAILLKGPVALALFLVILSANGMLEWRVTGSVTAALARNRWRLGIGLSVIVTLASLWFIAANSRTNGEFFRVFFWHHNVDRALGTSGELASHPWWYYGPRLLVDTAPWSVLILPATVWFCWRRRSLDDREARFGLTWLVSTVAVLSCARFKRADYLLPAYPGLALLVGCTLERWWGEAPAWIRRPATIGFAGVVAAVIALWGCVLHIELPAREAEREQKSFASAIRGVAPAPQVILFFRTECHALVFHLGRPVNTFLEWENLDVWAGREGPHYIVMSPECADEWPLHVTSGKLERVLSNTELAGGRHEKPLVLMRTRPNAESCNAASRQQTGDCRCAAERGDSDLQSGRKIVREHFGMDGGSGKVGSLLRNPTCR